MGRADHSDPSLGLQRPQAECDADGDAQGKGEAAEPSAGLAHGDEKFLSARAEGSGVCCEHWPCPASCAPLNLPPAAEAIAEYCDPYGVDLIDKGREEIPKNR